MADIDRQTQGHSRYRALPLPFTRATLCYASTVLVATARCPCLSATSRRSSETAGRFSTWRFPPGPSPGGPGVQGPRVPGQFKKNNFPVTVKSVNIGEVMVKSLASCFFDSRFSTVAF